MTENQLRELVIKTMNISQRDMPTYHIDLRFHSKPISDSVVESFVVAAQTKLDEHNAGKLDVYGIDEDYRAGSFLIKCTRPEEAVKVFELIKPIAEATPFFENGHARVRLPLQNGYYRSAYEPIQEDPETVIEIIDPELPVKKFPPSPEKKAVMVLIGLIVVLLLLLM